MRAAIATQPGSQETANEDWAGIAVPAWRPSSWTA